MVHLDQKQIKIGILICVFVIATIGYYFYKTLKDNSEDTIQISEENQIWQEETKEEPEEQLIVHIAGEVKNPGIVKIEEGARIADIIEKAGGLNKEADITNINLAYPVEDGQKITIPKKGEQIQEYVTEESNSSITNTQGVVNKKVNINKALIEELQTLEGVRRIYSTKNYRL